MTGEQEGLNNLGSSSHTGHDPSYSSHSKDGNSPKAPTDHIYVTRPFNHVLEERFLKSPHFSYFTLIVGPKKHSLSLSPEISDKSAE